MSDPPTDFRLEQLEERWSRDRTSRLFLQLAEEYRRRRRLDEALEVLRTGLAAHPGYLSAQVALGRCHLDRGEPAEARAVFDHVLERDPTHLVGAKLLVESLVRLDDAAGARDALTRYRLVSPSDEEAEELESRIARLRRPAGGAAPTAGAAEPTFDPTADAAVDPVLAPSRSAPVEAAAEGGEVFHLAAAAAPPSLRELARGNGRRLVGGGPDPFRLPAAEPRPRAGGELFDLRAAPAAAPSPLPAEMPPPPEAPGRAPDEPPWEAPDERPDLPFEQPPVEEPPPTAPPVEEPPPEEPPPGQPPEEPPPVEEPPSDEPPREPPQPLPPPAGEPPGREEPPWQAEPAETAPLAAGAEAGATVTLGELYLSQGHLREAEAIFRRVLAREPGHPGATVRLRELADRPLVAADELLGDQPPPAGLTARKILVLQRYLDVLGRGADDVSRTIE